MPNFRERRFRYLEGFFSHKRQYWLNQYCRQICMSVRKTVSKHFKNYHSIVEKTITKYISIQFHKKIYVGTYIPKWNLYFLNEL